MILIPTTPALPEGYADWLKQLKADIAHAQQRAALAVNAELVQLYGRIGRDRKPRAGGPRSSPVWRTI